MHICKADISKAVEYEKSMALRTSEGRLYPVWNTSISEIGEHGVGLMLYFYYLKWMAVGLFFMALISFPAWYKSMSGHVISEDRVLSVIKATTLAHTPDLQEEIRMGGDDEDETQGWGYFFAVYCDLIYTLFFILWVTGLKLMARKKALDFEDCRVLAEDYAIKLSGISNLTHEHCTNIARSFSLQFGLVREVVIVTDNGTAIR